MCMFINQNIQLKIHFFIKGRQEGNVLSGYLDINSPNDMYQMGDQGFVGEKSPS